MLFGERIARLFDELFWRLFDVVWTTEAGLKCFDFAAKLEDAVLEVGFVLLVDVLWNLEIDVVARDGEAKAAKLFGGNFWHARGLSEVLNEELIGVHELVVVKGDRIGDSAR